MNHLLRIESLAPELNYPGFWSLKRLIFLKAILLVCRDKKTIKQTQLPTIKKQIATEFNAISSDDTAYKISKQDTEECNHVIELLENNGWNCCYFNMKTKPIRPSVLPSNKEDLRDYSFAKNVLNHFWSGQIDNRQSISVIFLLELMRSTGISLMLFKEIIKVTNKLIINNEYIKLSQLNDQSNSFCIPLSTKLKLLFYQLKLDKITSADILSTMQLTLTDNITQFNQQSAQNHFPMEKLIKALENDFFMQGMEAVIVSQLKRYPLPVSLPTSSVNEPIVFRYTYKAYKMANKTAYKPMLIHRKSQSTHSENINFQADRMLLNSNETPYETLLNWNHECIITIKSLFFQLKKTLVSSDGTYTNGKVEKNTVLKLTHKLSLLTLNRAKDNALKKANLQSEFTDIHQALVLLFNCTTSLDLALMRIKHHLIKEQNTLDTCMKEISSIFLYGFFQLPGTENLEAFEEEELEILSTDIIFNRNHKKNLSEQYKVNLQQQLFSLLRWSQTEKNLFLHLEIPPNPGQVVALTKRNHAIGPAEFDLLKQPTDPTLYLAFYAGLRSGEIASLSLVDVFTSRHEVMIYIQKGKTPSAKRSIPLHLLAPKKVVDSVREYIECRNIDYRVYCQKNKSTIPLKRAEVKLLSLNQDCKKSTSKEVVLKARQLLKKQLGDGADLHLLRHSFASHLFLRWYCTRHTDFITQLVDQHHWFFSERGLSAFNTFLGNHPINDFKGAETTAIIQLIKLMGHKNTETFFAVYVHSFEEVVHHAIRQVNQKTDEQIMSGQLMATLLPNMRSRKSQAKIKDRRLSALAKKLDISID